MDLTYLRKRSDHVVAQTPTDPQTVRIEALRTVSNESYPS